MSLITNKTQLADLLASKVNLVKEHILFNSYYKYSITPVYKMLIEVSTMSLLYPNTTTYTYYQIQIDNHISYTSYYNETVLPIELPIELPTIQEFPDPISKEEADLLIALKVSEGAECPITHAPLQVDNSVVTTCHHVFDKDAMKMWIDMGNISCPYCRTEPVSVT